MPTQLVPVGGRIENDPEIGPLPETAIGDPTWDQAPGVPPQSGAIQSSTRFNCVPEMANAAVTTLPADSDVEFKLKPMTDGTAILVGWSMRWKYAHLLHVWFALKKADIGITPSTV